MEIKKAFPTMDTKRLVEWQKKGYLKKLINKWYLFSEVAINENLLYRISNCLLQPSYVSLASALSYYNLIPEAVYTHQAVSTRKTTKYDTVVGLFQYQTIPTSCYFGYTIVRNDNFPVLIAEPEKALLDYFYLNAGLKTQEDLKAMRLNITELENRLDWKKLFHYAKAYESRTLMKRLNIFQKIMNNAPAD
jgi:predicted transcriptional regulator of viral defense system